MLLSFNALRQVHHRVLITLRFGILASCVLLSSACSPGMFFGGSEDNGVANTRNYRRVNTACAGLNLASSTLDVPTFRQLLHCFNSNGALEPIENLMSRLPDADVQPIVEMGNRYILNNRKLLYQLERTYNTLSDRKILDNTLLQFGRMLENEEFVSSSIALLKEGYAAQHGPFSFAADKNILKALEHLSTKITYENTADLTDTALTVARSKVFNSLQSHFVGDSPTGRSLRDLTDQLLLYLQETGDPHHVEVGYSLIHEVVTGSLFRAVDEPEVLGTDVEGLRSSIPRLASVMDVTLGNGAQIMDGLTSLFHYAHQPIYCLKRSQKVPDGAMYILHELNKVSAQDAASFIKRKNILTIMAMDPLCDFPSQLGDYYPTMFSFADVSAIEPSTDLIKSFYRSAVTIDAGGREQHPLAQLLVNVLADTGSSAQDYPGGPAENTVGIKRLLPILSELNDRRAWEDVMLLLSMPRLEDRGEIQNALRFLIEPIPGTDQSIYIALSDAIARASPESLYNFVYSLRRFVRSNKPILDPALTAIRQAYYVNDVHPVIDLVHDILADAMVNDKLFNTAFIISEMPEFQSTVRLVSDMSKDGRLKELTGAVLTLFHKFAMQGRTEIHDATEPAFVPKSRHDWNENDLGGFTLTEEPAVSNNSCRMLDPRIPMGDYRNGHFYEQVDDFVVCMNADNRHRDFGESISFLRGSYNERGKRYLEFAFDLVHALDMTTQQLGYLGQSFIRAVDDLRIYHMMDALPMFVSRRDAGTPTADGPAMRPLLDLFRPIMEGWVRPGVQRLESVAGSVLRRADFPTVLRYADVLMDRTPEPAIVHPPQNFYWDRIERWIWNKECQNLPLHSPASVIEKYKHARSLQITDDYNYQVTTSDLVDGQPRRTWKYPEFHDLLNDMFTKLGDPEQSVVPGAVMDSLPNVMRYFTLPEGKEPNRYQHYHRDELRKFLADRSTDYQLITYYYPGESVPRVRLVNTMDRLELVLTNADFFAPWPFVSHFPFLDFKNQRNFGMLFLGQMADAWGDEPESIWPQEIKDKFKGGRPPTLAEAVAKIMSTARQFEQLVGLPELPYCTQVADPNDPPDLQYYETHDPVAHSGGLPSWLPGFHVPLLQKSLFNIHQVQWVLGENLPKPGVPLGTGGKMVNGMRILRDLFFQLHYSTPLAYRRADFHHTADGAFNNLSVILRLVRVGLTHQVTRNLRNMNANDPSVHDFFDSLISGATNSDDDLATTARPHYHVRQLLDPLVDPQLDSDPKNPQHDLLWKVVQEIFGIIDAAEGGDLDEKHKKEITGKPTDEVERIKAEWVRELGRMRQLGFYTVAQAGPMKLIDPFLKTAGPVLRVYSTYLRNHADRVGSLLRSKKTSYFMRALYEDPDGESKGHLGSVLQDLFNEPQDGIDAMGVVKAIDLDPGAKKSWDLLSDRWDYVTGLPEYKLLHMDESTRQILDFLEEQGTSSDGVSAARRLRAYAAERLEQGDLDQLMVLMRSKPNDFYRILEMISAHTQDGELKDFAKMAREALSDSPRSF